MKRKLIICGILAIFCMLISVGNAENHVDGKAQLEEILSSYSAEHVVLSHQVQRESNFRPGRRRNLGMSG